MCKCVRRGEIRLLVCSTNDTKRGRDSMDAREVNVCVCVSEQQKERKKLGE